MPPIDEISIPSTISSKANDFKALTPLETVHQKWENSKNHKEENPESPPLHLRRAQKMASTNKEEQPTPPNISTTPMTDDSATPITKNATPTQPSSIPTPTQPSSGFGATIHPLASPLPSMDPHPHETISEAICSGENKFHNKNIAESDPEDYIHPNYLKKINTIIERRNAEMETKVIKRTPLSGKIVYNGDLKTFKNYKSRVRGHFRQVGAGYLFNPRF